MKQSIHLKPIRCPRRGWWPNASPPHEHSKMSFKIKKMFFSVEVKLIDMQYCLFYESWSTSITSNLSTFSKLTQTKLEHLVIHAEPESSRSQTSRVMTIQCSAWESRPATTSCRRRVKAIRCFCQLKKKRQLRKLWHSSFSLCALSPP